MSEDTGLDARARYAILKKLNATMPPARGRGQRLRRDCSLKAEETDTGQVVPTRLRFLRTGAFREGSGRVTSA
jgi:hypothetical protein